MFCEDAAAGAAAALGATAVADAAAEIAAAAAAADRAPAAATNEQVRVPFAWERDCRRANRTSCCSSLHSVSLRSSVPVVYSALLVVLRLLQQAPLSRTLLFALLFVSLTAVAAVSRRRGRYILARTPE